MLSASKLNPGRLRRLPIVPVIVLLAACGGQASPGPVATGGSASAPATQAPGSRALTTQLYCPGVSANQQDSIFDARLLLKVQPSATGLTATFDFILDG